MTFLFNCYLLQSQMQIAWLQERRLSRSCVLHSCITKCTQRAPFTGPPVTERLSCLFFQLELCYISVSFELIVLFCCNTVGLILLYCSPFLTCQWSIQWATPLQPLVAIGSGIPEYGKYKSNKPIFTSLLSSYTKHSSVLREERKRIRDL